MPEPIRLRAWKDVLELDCDFGPDLCQGCLGVGNVVLELLNLGLRMGMRHLVFFNSSILAVRRAT
eukprot:2073101-Pyramimonas_sp.AAC.1